MFDYNNPYGMYGIGANYGAQLRFPNQMMNQSPMMQNVPQQAQNTPQTSISAAIVPTIENVENVQMAPGEIKIIMIQNNPNYMAIRVADRAGFVSTEYRETHIVDPKTLNSVPQYAPIESVEALKNEIQQLKNMIGGGLNESDAKHAVRSEQSGNEQPVRNGSKRRTD